MYRQTIRFLVLLGWMLAVGSSCKKASLNCGLVCDNGESLLFQTTFSNAEVVPAGDQGADLTGIDPNFTELNDWEAIDAHPNLGKFAINYEAGSPDQRYARVVPDPMDSSNEVLQFKIVEPHIYRNKKAKKGRVQFHLSGNNCIREVYQTVRLYLHPDMAHLKSWEEEIHWLSLFEFWNNANYAGEKHPFRVTVNLVKASTGPADDLHFEVKADQDKTFGGFDILWAETATQFSVPFGEWMDLELYIREGDASEGRFLMRVTPQGGQQITLFDLNRLTQHPKTSCPDGFSHFHPLKFYTSADLISYMNASEKNLEIYWDDWVLFRNKQP